MFVCTQAAAAATKEEDQAAAEAEATKEDQEAEATKEEDQEEAKAEATKEDQEEAEAAEAKAKAGLYDLIPPIAGTFLRAGATPQITPFRRQLGAYVRGANVRVWA